MAVLILLRHGQAALGKENYDALSPLGVEQAMLAGRRLAGSATVIDHVYSGALVRQRDTAAAVMQELALPVSDMRIDDRLDEYDHIGVLRAQTSAVKFETATTAEQGRELQTALDKALARWAAGDDVPDVESHAGFLRRVLSVTAELAALPGTTLAATSGGVIGVAAALHLGLPVDQWPRLARVSVNAAVTKLITGRSGTTLVTFNDHAHLEADRGLITYR